MFYRAFLAYIGVCEEYPIFNTLCCYKANSQKILGFTQRIQRASRTEEMVLHVVQQVFIFHKRYVNIPGWCFWLCSYCFFAVLQSWLRFFLAWTHVIILDAAMTDVELTKHLMLLATFASWITVWYFLASFRGKTLSFGYVELHPYFCCRKVFTDWNWIYGTLIPRSLLSENP